MPRISMVSNNEETNSTKQLSSCSCPCHSPTVIVETTNLASDNDAAQQSGTAQQRQRPTMETLQKLLQERQWEQVQRAIQLDSSVTMRIDDSAEEDFWVDEARRRWFEQTQKTDGAENGAEWSHLFAQTKQKRQYELAANTEDDNPPMQLRYWVGNNGSNNNSNSEAYKLRRMTLLHSLCRLDFSPQDAEHERDSDDVSQDNVDFTMAIQTAEMIISASHNEQKLCCPCKYCPPMFFQAVSKGDDDGDEVDDSSEVELHTSALTVPDKMGGTPLHELACSGSQHIHIELVKALFRGCAQSNMNDSWRPSVYDLLTAPNDYGSTPLHYIAESYQTGDKVLRYILEQCPLCSTSNDDRYHPSMVKDNEGDLPIHYASSNCVPPECLDILTSLGDKRSALIPNSRHRLPVDELIEWYHDNLEEFFEQQNTDNDDSEKDNSDDDSEGDSEDYDESSNDESQLMNAIADASDNHQGAVESVNADANVNRLARKWNSFQCNNFCPDLFPYQSHGRCYLCPARSIGLVIMGEGSGSQHFWESDLWKQMILLVTAAAEAILSANRTDEANDDETYASILCSNALHASVIATKYGHFPAFPLAMSSPLNESSRNDMAAKFLLGCLPLHWACGDVSFLLNSTYSSETKYQLQQSPSTKECNELVRFNTYHLGITLVQYLLLLCPEAARIPTKEHGELPLHLYLQDKYMLWNYVAKKGLEREREANEIQCTLEASCTPWEEIKSLLSSCPEALSTPSCTTHLYPFQLAAAASHSSSSNEEEVDTRTKTRLLSLENTYYLILEDPSVVCGHV